MNYKISKVTMAVLLASSVATAAQAREGTYSVKMDGALTEEFSSDALGTAGVSYSSPLMMRNVAAGGDPAKLGAGATSSLAIKVGTDGRVIALTTNAAEDYVIGRDSTVVAYIRAGTSRSILGAHDSNAAGVQSRLGTPGDCSLDTATPGVVVHDCSGPGNTGVGTAMVQNDSRGSTVNLGYDNANGLFGTGQDIGFRCYSSDVTSPAVIFTPAPVLVNGCASANVGGAVCDVADAVVSGTEPVGPAGTATAVGAVTDLDGLNTLQFCDSDAIEYHTQGAINATGQGEGFKVEYTYTGSLGESSFAMTGVKFTQYNLTAGLAGGRTTVNVQEFGQAYDTAFAAATGAGLVHPYGGTAPVTNEVAFDASGKNVPAMGAFGLAALFGGLVAVALRLRRRVS